jgi:hypothetical protein
MAVNPEIQRKWKFQRVDNAQVFVFAALVLSNQSLITNFVNLQ